jgi:hypothetical protein
MNLVREPDAGEPPVRFDEREVETEHGMRIMRHRPGKPRNRVMPKPTPPRHLSTLHQKELELRQNGKPNVEESEAIFTQPSNTQHPTSTISSPATWPRIHAFLHARRSLLSTQGVIVASWRSYQGRRLGPYHRLAYREQGRQRSLYLGCAIDLVRLVRRTLTEFQRTLCETQVFRRLRSAARKALRASKDRLRQHLAAVGIRLQGFEFRGVRAAFARGLRPLPAFAAASESALQPPPPFIPPVPPSLRTWFWRRCE